MNEHAPISERILALVKDAGAAGVTMRALIESVYAKRVMPREPAACIRGRIKFLNRQHTGTVIDCHNGRYRLGWIAAPPRKAAPVPARIGPAARFVNPQDMRAGR